MKFAASMLMLLPLVLASSGNLRNVVPVIGGYEFIDTPTNWTEAYAGCAELGGQLAVPQTAAEGAALLQLMIEHGASEAHVGFHDLFVENEYFTVLGQSLAQVGFQQGALVQADDADCGSLTSDGFKSSPCSAELPAICQLPPGADYDLLPNFGHYKLHKEKVPWTRALLACRQEGADLLVMHSVEEYTALISRYLNMTTGYWVHYGAHHAFADQRFVTIFGEPLAESGFIQWYNEPNASNEKNPFFGLTIPQQGRDRGLHLIDDNFLNFYICKRDLHT